MNPLIGVTGPNRGGEAAWLFTSAALKRAGGRAKRITPSRPDDGGELDGLVVGGGADVDPSQYRDTAERLGEVMDAAAAAADAGWTTWSSKIWAPSVFLVRRMLARQGDRRFDRGDPERDALERTLVARAVERGLPILGICRGAQLMNVHFGGTLWVDLGSFYVEEPKIRTVLPRKVVEIAPGSHLAEALGTTQCHVNALHDQAIRSVGHGLEVVAREATGVVQAIEQPTHPFRIGVQWHPEYIPQHRRQRALFERLVLAALRREVLPAA